MALTQVFLFVLSLFAGLAWAQNLNRNFNQTRNSGPTFTSRRVVETDVTVTTRTRITQIGWVQSGGRAFILHPQRVTYAEALLICSRQYPGSTLAIVSTGERASVQNLIRSRYGVNDNFWIGGSGQCNAFYNDFQCGATFYPLCTSRNIRGAGVVVGGFAHVPIQNRIIVLGPQGFYGYWTISSVTAERVFIRETVEERRTRLTSVENRREADIVSANRRTDRQQRTNQQNERRINQQAAQTNGVQQRTPISRNDATRQTVQRFDQDGANQQSTRLNQKSGGQTQSFSQVGQSGGGQQFGPNSQNFGSRTSNFGTTGGGGNRAGRF